MRRLRGKKMTVRYNNSVLMGADEVLAQCAQGAQINCTAAGTCMLVLRSGALLPIPLAVGPNIVDYVNVVGYKATGSSGTFVVYGLFE
jgi:hypothetical protein